MTRDEALALVTDLTAATARAHTELTLVATAADVLARHLPLCALELGLCDRAASTAADTLTARPRPARPGDAPPAVTRAAHPLHGSLAARALARRDVQRAALRPHAATARRAPPLPPDARRARGAGASALCVVPLADADGVAGYAALALDPARGGAPRDADDAVLLALARVLLAAVRQVQLLGRVAALSRRAHAENQVLRDELRRATLPTSTVAASDAMRAILHETVPLVARQDTTVLLLGESGVGKEVVARAVHALSPRAPRPFLKVNCGALPETLLESALFGHEKGAFTGAAARSAGVFERAHGGTLLLDEVGELPLAAQVKLLRVLADGEFERVGGQSTVRTSVRVVAATHRPLEAMVAAGAFRADLYYRLSVFPITVPPLRERPADIDALAGAIVARLAARFGRARAPRLTAPVLARLRAYRWPGNVRELENVLERAMVLSAGELLALPEGFERGGGPVVPSARASEERAPVESYRDAVRRCITAALAASGGRIWGPTGAAARLGLKPTTLQSKMKKLGIARAG